MKKILIMMASIVLLAGCQSRNTGGTDTTTDTGLGTGSSWSRDTNSSTNRFDTNNTSQDINK